MTVSHRNCWRTRTGPRSTTPKLCQDSKAPCLRKPRCMTRMLENRAFTMIELFCQAREKRCKLRVLSSGLEVRVSGGRIKRKVYSIVRVVVIKDCCFMSIVIGSLISSGALWRGFPSPMGRNRDGGSFFSRKFLGFTTGNSILIHGVWGGFQLSFCFQRCILSMAA